MRSPLPQALLLSLSLAGCVSTPGNGPDMGPCADVPDHVYSYGDIQIGRCLAGPSDVRFAVQDGNPWLVVANGNAFLDFNSGSILTIDASTLGPDPLDLRSDELDSFAVPTPNFLGQLGLFEQGRRLLVPSRASDGHYVDGSSDQALFFDLSDMRAPRYATPRYLPTRADPYAVALDPLTGLAFVANATSTTLSVYDVTGETPILLDPAPHAKAVAGALQRSPGSAGMAEATPYIDTGMHIDKRDTYKLTRAPASDRVWIPAPDGLYRYTVASEGLVASSALPDITPEVFGRPDLLDPVFFQDLTNLLLGLLVSDGTDIRRAWSNGSPTGFTADVLALTHGTGWLARLAGPSLASVNGRNLLYFDASPADQDTPQIGLAFSADGARYTPKPAPILPLPEGYIAAAQPWVFVDPSTHLVRMYMSLYDGTRWAIGHAVSTDAGETWPTPEIVLESVSSIGAPIVIANEGRFHLFATQGGPQSWQVVEASSFNGYDWTTPTPVLSLSPDLTDARPPRTGLQPAGFGGWRVASADGTVLAPLATAGERWTGYFPRGVDLYTASGHAIGTQIDPNTALDIEPASTVQVGASLRLYASGVDSLHRSHLLALKLDHDVWSVEQSDLIAPSTGGNLTGVRSPVAFQTDAGFEMFYAAADLQGITHIHHATSTDGLHFTPAAQPLAIPDFGQSSSTAFEPSQVDILDAHTITLWMSAGDKERWRIAQATYTRGPDQNWTLSSTSPATWSLDLGLPGSFDDAGVRQPTILHEVRDGQPFSTMWYGAFDGEIWRIGQATREGTGPWQRRIIPTNPIPQPVLSEVAGTFAMHGVRSPVLTEIDGEPVLLHAGNETTAWRVGYATVGPDLEVWPMHALPEPGDWLPLDIWRSDLGRSEIDLRQNVQGFALPGISNRPSNFGPTSLVLDADAGLLWVGSQDLAGLIAIDVRDDSTPDHPDLNYLNIETVLRFATSTTISGITDLIAGPPGTLIATTSTPDGFALIDVSHIPDNDVAEVVDGTSIYVHPLHDMADDAGKGSAAMLPGVGPAYVPDQNLLLVPNFRDNSLSVFDLSLGAYGEEIAYLSGIGENPYFARVSPDGTYAVIGIFRGSYASLDTESELKILDLRRDSPTWLQITGRIANR